MSRTLTIISAVFFTVSSLEAKIVERVVAKVNDEVITLTELEAEKINFCEELRRAGLEGKELEEECAKREKDALENLIQTKILLQRAREMGFAANVDIEVSARIQRIMQEYNMKSTDELARALEGQGMTLEGFREQLARKIIIDRFIGQFVGSKITITGEEIEKYYREHVAQFTKPEEVELAEIFFSTDGKPEAEVEQQALRVLELARNGADFAELAKQYSQGPTASDGGSIGTFTRNSMAPAIEKIAFSLKPGEVHGSLIKTKGGFQILKLLKRTEAEVAPLEKVRDTIREAIYRQKFQVELNKFIEQLKKESYIHIYPETEAANEKRS